MTDPKPLSTLLGELQAVRAEGVALSSTLPDAPTTKAHRARQTEEKETPNG